MAARLKADPWIPYLWSEVGARLHLFCFAYAGGGTIIFRSWWRDLPSQVAVYPIELPGRGSRIREAPFTRLTPLIEALAQAIQPYLTPPFAFFGHSMGALIGFELARHLRRQDAPLPIYLFVSGHRAPQLPDPDPPIHHLPAAEFMKGLRLLNGTPSEVLGNKELMQLLLPSLRADFAVCETYVYKEEAPLACPISAFGGLQDDKVGRNELEKWHEQTSSTFALRMFPGDHFFLKEAQRPLLQALCQDVVDYLS